MCVCSTEFEFIESSEDYVVALDKFPYLYPNETFSQHLLTASKNKLDNTLEDSFRELLKIVQQKNMETKLCDVWNCFFSYPSKITRK